MTFTRYIIYDSCILKICGISRVPYTGSESWDCIPILRLCSQSWDWVITTHAQSWDWVITTHAQSMNFQFAWQWVIYCACCVACILDKCHLPSEAASCNLEASILVSNGRFSRCSVPSNRVFLVNLHDILQVYCCNFIHLFIHDSISLRIMHVPHAEHVESLKWRNTVERWRRTFLHTLNSQVSEQSKSLRCWRASHLLSPLSCHPLSFVEQLAS